MDRSGIFACAHKYDFGTSTVRIASLGVKVKHGAARGFSVFVTMALAPCALPQQLSFSSFLRLAEQCEELIVI